MSELAARMRGLFLEIAEPGVACPPAMPRTAGLLAPRRVATATGALLALALAHAHRARSGVLCHFGPAPGGAPPNRAARHAAAVLRERGLQADAVGRLARVVLDEDTSLLPDTIAEVKVAAPLPAVLAIDRARDKDVDAALKHLEAVALLDSEHAEASLTALAVPSLTALGTDVFGLAAPGPLGRRMAVAGIVPPGLARVGLATLAGSNRSSTLAPGRDTHGERQSAPISSRGWGGPTNQ